MHLFVDTGRFEYLRGSLCAAVANQTEAPCQKFKADADAARCATRWR